MASWRTFGRCKETNELEGWCAETSKRFMPGIIIGRWRVCETQFPEDVQTRQRGRRQRSRSVPRSSTPRQAASQGLQYDASGRPRPQRP